MKTLSEVEVLVKMAAQEALSNFKREQKKGEKKAILHNTEILLREYLELKHFYENCNHTGVVEEEVITVGSLRRDKATTQLLYRHVTQGINRMKEKEPEKIKVIEILYMDQTFETWTWENKIYQAMMNCNISQPTVYRWKNEIIADLSVMLFGADGLRIWTI